MEEIWKISYLTDKYEVSNLGKIRNSETKKVLINRLKGNYYQVGIRFNNKRNWISVHRLILSTFAPISNISKLCVNHKNCNKLDNNLENLEWCSYQENMNHAMKNNLLPKGSNNHNSKLLESDVLDIRKLWLEPNRKTSREIAKLYNVTHRVILLIVNRKTWTHI